MPVVPVLGNTHSCFCSWVMSCFFTAFGLIVVVQSLSHVWLCDPMDCRTPGFPVLHYLSEFAQTHVSWVEDAMQPSHPLSSSSPPAFDPSQYQSLFQWVGCLNQVPKVLELQFSSSVQSLSRVRFFATPWTAAPGSLSIAISWSLLKLMSIELVMPSNHLILCHPLLLSSNFPSIRVFSNESVLVFRVLELWKVFNLSNEYSGSISFKTE